MRRALLLLLLATGCENFSTLTKDFCTTAKVSHTDVKDKDGANVDMLEAEYPDDLGFFTHNVAVAVCDDFEKTALDSTVMWGTNVVLGGTLQPELYGGLTKAQRNALSGDDPQAAYRGRGVLHAIAPANGAAQIVDTQLTKMQPTPAIRAFVWPGAGEVAGTTELFSLSDENGNEIRRVSLVNGVPQLLDIASDQSVMAPGQLTPGTWNCVNFFSRPTRMDVILDSGVAATLSGLPVAAQAFQTNIGPARGSDASSGPSEMWIDEVIIDQVLVGCDP